MKYYRWQYSNDKITTYECDIARRLIYSNLEMTYPLVTGKHTRLNWIGTTEWFQSIVDTKPFIGHGSFSEDDVFTY